MSDKKAPSEDYWHEKDVDPYGRRLKEYEDELAKAHAEKLGLLEEITELREEKDEMQERAEDLGTEVLRLREEKEHQFRALLTCREENASLRVQVRIRESDNVRLIDERDRLREDLDTRTAMLQANDDKWANAVAEIASLRAAYDLAKRDLTECEQELITARENLTIYGNQTVEMMKIIASLREAVDAALGNLENENVGNAKEWLRNALKGTNESRPETPGE